MNLIHRARTTGHLRYAPALALMFLSLFSDVSGAADLLTVDEVVERAVPEAPQVAMAEASLQRARDLARGAGKLPDPEAVAGIDNLPVSTADAFSVSRDSMTMRRVGVAQSVPSAAKRGAQRALAAREVDLAEARLAAGRFAAAQAAGDAWVDCAVASRTLELLRASREELAPLATAARASQAGGRRAAGALLATELTIARLDDRILAWEAQLATRRAELSRWVGVAAERALGPLPSDRALDAGAATVTHAVDGHSPLAPAAAEVDRARAAVQVAKAARHPDWSTELSYGRRGSGYSDMVSLEFRVGLPLFTRHRQDPLIAASLADLRAREAEQRSAVRAHLADIDAELARWRAGQARLRHYAEVLLPVASDQTRAMIRAYAAGRGDLMAVIAATTEEADLLVERVALQGEVSRAWLFLTLLESPEAP